MKRIFFLFLGFLLICPKVASAQADDDDGLPFEQFIREFLFIESRYAQEKKEWQFTLDVPYLYRNTQLGISLLSEYGLTDRLQAELAFSIDDLGESGSELEAGLL